MNWLITQQTMNSNKQVNISVKKLVEINMLESLLGKLFHRMDNFNIGIQGTERNVQRLNRVSE